MIPACDRRSDGRTDGWTESIIAKTALCIASYADALSKMDLRHGMHTYHRLNLPHDSFTVTRKPLLSSPHLSTHVKFITTLQPDG